MTTAGSLRSQRAKPGLEERLPRNWQPADAEWIGHLPALHRDRFVFEGAWKTDASSLAIAAGSSAI